MNHNVLNKIELDLKIYYTGLPVKKFNDYKLLIDDLTSGDLIEKISKNEVDESLMNNM